MNAGMKGGLIGGALIAGVCFAAFSIYKSNLGSGSNPSSSSGIVGSTANPLPNPFRQKQQKRIVVMETADRAAYYDVGQSAPVGNGYNLCKEHFNAMTPQEFDAILANGGIVVGSPSDIRENSMRVSQSVLGFGNLKCQMRDYIIEQ
jgi:hypothetical protein